MSLPVSLPILVEELESQPDEWRIYLNRETGEIVTLTADAVNRLENGESLEELSDWEREDVETAQEVLYSDKYLILPSKYEIHEYEIMRDFCYSVPYRELREELLYKIRGSGAFRRFRRAIEYHGMTEEWYEYRDAAIEKIAIRWLEGAGIPYTRERIVEV